MSCSEDCSIKCSTLDTTSDFSHVFEMISVLVGVLFCFKAVFFTGLPKLFKGTLFVDTLTPLTSTGLLVAFVDALAFRTFCSAILISGIVVLSWFWWFWFKMNMLSHYVSYWVIVLLAIKFLWNTGSTLPTSFEPFETLLQWYIISTHDSPLDATQHFNHWISLRLFWCMRWMFENIGILNCFSSIFEIFKLSISAQLAPPLILIALSCATPLQTQAAIL